MVQKEKDCQPNQIIESRAKYRAQGKGEGKAIMAGCLAAAKISDFPVYVSHSASPIKAAIEGRLVLAGNLKFPEGTRFFQLIHVRYGVRQHEFVTVELEGERERKKTSWRVRSVCAHGHLEILNKKEIGKFS